jgi:hypothetical protein
MWPLAVHTPQMPGNKGSEWLVGAALAAFRGNALAAVHCEPE